MLGSTESPPVFRESLASVIPGADRNHGQHCVFRVRARGAAGGPPAGRPPLACGPRRCAEALR